MREIVYLLCALTSVACMALLYRAYRRTRLTALFWSSAAFLAIAFSNTLLFIDLVLVPHYDLSLYRQVTTLLGVILLLYGLIRTNS
jgi:hypothetical protein